MTSTLLGLPFFRKNNIVIHPLKGLLCLPELTISLALSRKYDRKLSKQKISHTFSKITIHPNQQEIIECELINPDKAYEYASGLIEPSIQFESKSGLCIMPSISKLDGNCRTYFGIMNLNPNKIKITAKPTVAKFEVLTSKQASFIKPIHPSLCSLIKSYEQDNNYLKSAQNLRQQAFHEKSDGFWFPTPENCKDASKLMGVEKKNYESLMKFKEEEMLDPTINDTKRKPFRKKFNWDESIFNISQKKKMEELLVRFHKIFTQHLLDLVKNTDSPVKLTPEHNRLVYSPNAITPIHLRDELIIQLALMQYYDIITTLPFSKYSSPIFAQRKSSGKLRILIDLRKINHLLRHDTRIIIFIFRQWLMPVLI